MKLILGWNGTIEAPNTTQIETALHEMPGGENSFVIPELKSGQFIQTHGAAGLGFLVEYWENGKGHSCTTTDLSMDMVVHLFSSYAQGDDAWRNSVSWEEMGGISGTKIKQGKPRYTRKGTMRLVLFAALFLLTCIVFTPLGLTMGGLVTVVPGMLIYVDLHYQKLHYALPSPLFTVLVNLFLIPLVIGILTTLPWKDLLTSCLLYKCMVSALIFQHDWRVILYLQFENNCVDRCVKGDQFLEAGHHEHLLDTLNWVK